MHTTLSLILALTLASAPGFKNPIINSDYSDPDAICVNGEYWMTASSFGCAPGLQILHSTDLLNWEIVGAALPEGVSTYARDLADGPGAKASPGLVPHGDGVFAPSIRYRESTKEFFIFWGDPDRGIYQVHTQTPQGKWSEPVLVKEGKGYIDTCPLFDEDGRVYLVHGWAGSRAGFNSVLSLVELNSDATECISAESMIFDGRATRNPTVEGPKIYKKDGYYYIFAPAGGVQDGWQLVLRSKSPYGPYEWRRVLEAGGNATHGPHQGAWVQDAKGDDWFIHFEDRYAWGRVVHLQPLKWDKEGWCIIGVDNDSDGIGEPVLEGKAPAAFPAKPLGGVGAEETSTSFEGTSIPLNWQWASAPEYSWYMTSPAEKALRLNCRKQAEGFRNLWDCPQMLLEKLVGPSMELNASLEFQPSYKGDRAGMIVMGAQYCTIELYYDGTDVYLQKRICLFAERGGKETIAESVKLDSKKVNLKIRVHEEGKNWPPVVMAEFLYEDAEGQFKTLGEPFKAAAGKWIGAKTGFFATAEIHRNEGGCVYIR